VWQRSCNVKQHLASDWRALYLFKCNVCVRNSVGVRRAGGRGVALVRKCLWPQTQGGGDYSCVLMSVGVLGSGYCRCVVYLSACSLWLSLLMLTGLSWIKRGFLSCGFLPPPLSFALSLALSLPPSPPQEGGPSLPPSEGRGALDSERFLEERIMPAEPCRAYRESRFSWQQHPH
jgi:hypothetical protein